MPAPASPRRGVPAEPVARLQQAMAAGTLTSAELTAFYLARIEAAQPPALCAVISVSPDAAAEAARSDPQPAAGPGRPGRWTASPS